MRNIVCLWVVAAVSLAGCSFQRVESYTPRTATEELLVARAFERAVKAVDVPDLTGRAVAVRLAIVGPGEEFASDAEFAKAIVEAAVLRKGGRLVAAKEADVIVTAVVSTLATTGRSMLIGLPQISTALLATPEVPFFKVLREKGYARLRLVTRDSHGRLLSESATVMRHMDFNVYTIFFISFHDNDIYDEPVIGID
jgi:hypothetical protein